VTRQRPRVLRELAAAGTLPQVTRWRPVLAGWVVAAAVLGWKADDANDAAGRVVLLRVVAVLLVVSVVGLVDDDAATVLAAVPVPLGWRCGVRFGLAAAAVAAPWAAALLWVRPGQLTAALTLECAAITAFGLAVASGIARWSDAREASLAAGPAVLGAAVAATLLPPRWAIFVPPDGDWADAHLRWAAVLGVALAVLVRTLRDPARRAIDAHPGRRSDRAAQRG
jgi:hypothetical protein